MKERDPLAKQDFLKGTRQKWFAVLLVLMVVILICDTYSDLPDADAYLNFLTITGSVFILGASVDSAMKIRNRNKYQDPYIEETHHD